MTHRLSILYCAIVLCTSCLWFSSICFAQINPSQIRVGQPKIDENHAASITFQRINLGPNLNSQYSELFPVVTSDEMIMFFVRKGDPSNAGYAKNPQDEDIWYTTRQSDGSWGVAARLEGPLNTENYDGVRAINAAGTRLYLQNVYRADGTRAKGFSVSDKQPDGSWAYPEGLEIEDYYNDTSVAMMSVSADENNIVLSLQRKDGMGKHDLYVSHHLEGHRWSKPEHIDDLSSAGDDISPFIAYDDRTIYFSTDGRGGAGSEDIFISHRLDDTWLHWSTPSNMGEPVNTPSFDAYFMVSAQGDTAYFSSPHETSTRGFGKSDIWKLGLAPSQRPGFNLPTANLNEIDEKELKGSLLRLDNVLFDVGKMTFKESSKQALDKVIEVMIKFPDLRIEVQGHTDSDGDPDKNMRLSQGRADAVKDYMVSHGVTVNRVTAQGYGQTKPIAPNTTARGKSLNRRVMMLVSMASGAN